MNTVKREDSVSGTRRERGEWIGVDLDGTLAHYNGWRGVAHIGPPIAPMLERVKTWLREGWDVRIFTARVCADQDGSTVDDARRLIEQWCMAHLGVVLPVTNRKDFGMVELWDDRCVQVQRNLGAIATTQASCVNATMHT